MARRITLNICHLYPDLMDTYGDRGNILAIEYRCRQRDIDFIYTPITVNDKLSADQFDLYFFGGGQDQAQEIVGRDLKKKAPTLINSIENGATLLSVCGGYQLLQENFKTKEGTNIPGIGLFKAYTVASDTRMIGNLSVEMNPKLASEIKIHYPAIQPSNYPAMLVGFENHSGKTYLRDTTSALATVLVGSGNNGEDKTEGVIYKNAFGCYMHGSLLPKNPQFADYLIAKALQRKNGKVTLNPLDDSLEWQVHSTVIEKISRKG